MTNTRRKGVRARSAAGDRRGTPAQRDSDGVPQFAPNFSVFVLPSASVCLYSEDRKFFLHGELYCALAAAIGAGKTFRQIYRELEKRFPADKIEEAFKRLADRRFIALKSRNTADAAAAYWASLGLPPQTATENLQKCRVRVQAIDVKGAAELEAALKKLGVRLVKGTTDLTVTLAGDYLDARLADENRRHLSRRTSWLLVQPSGIFPLVGPILSPGQTACWDCLAHRMIRNRETKAFIDRVSSQRVAASPLARDLLGRGGVELAALEIAKAIATGFRTDLRDHIVSLDLTGSAVVKHYVAHRPQCPSCGQEMLRDPGRAPEPIKLVGGGKLLRNSGGYRTVSSRATVERFRKHVSPLTGVVSRLERIEVDLPLNTNWLAIHNFSAPALSVDQLKSGLTGGSFGKGSTTEQAEASALMEAIERYSGIFQGDEIRMLRRFTDFPAGDAIFPNDVLLVSEAQVRQRLQEHEHEHMRREQPPTVVDSGEPPEMPIPTAAFDRSEVIEWSPAWSLRDKRFKYLPTTMLYFFYRGPEGFYVGADSNGCAAGNTREEAIVQGFLELVERDAYAIWWYNRLQRPEVDLSQFEDAYIRDLKNEFADTGRRVWLLDVTNDLGIPTFITISHWAENGEEFIEFGSGAHFDPRIAALRAMTELNQFLSIGMMGGRDTNLSVSKDAPFRLKDHPYLIPSGTSPIRPDAGAKFGSLDTRGQVLACVDLVKRAGLDFLVLDQTRPDIEVPVVRVLVPGLRHFYRRFAPGRLYDVPVKLGWRDLPISEAELNPLHPQT